jgi:hypothetical protein
MQWGEGTLRPTCIKENYLICYLKGIHCEVGKCPVTLRVMIVFSENQSLVPLALTLPWADYRSWDLIQLNWNAVLQGLKFGRIKIKRIRVPDILCLNTGLRFGMFTFILLPAQNYFDRIPPYPFPLFLLTQDAVPIWCPNPGFLPNPLSQIISNSNILDRY